MGEIKMSELANIDELDISTKECEEFDEEMRCTLVSDHAWVIADFSHFQ